VIRWSIHEREHESSDESEDGSGENEPFRVDVFCESSSSDHDRTSDNSDWKTVITRRKITKSTLS